MYLEAEGSVTGVVVLHTLLRLPAQSGHCSSSWYPAPAEQILAQTVRCGLAHTPVGRRRCIHAPARHSLWHGANLKKLFVVRSQPKGHQYRLLTRSGVRHFVVLA